MKKAVHLISLIIPQPDGSDESAFIEDNLAAYLKASQEGEALIYRAMLMVVGGSGDGKTSLIQRLIGEDINLEHLVTNALESDLSCKVSITKVSKAWSKILEDKGVTLENDILFSLESAMDKLKIGQADGSGESDDHSSPADSGVPLAGQSTQQQGSKEGAQAKPTTLIKEAEGRLRKMRKVRIQEPDQNSNETAACIFVWDFGGQKAYYTLHHVFLRAQCVYVLVINLNIPLDKKVGPLIGPGQIEDPSKKPDTYVETIEFWMNTILSHLRKGTNENDIRNVFIVGTHKDLLHPDKQQQEKLAKEYFAKLRSRLLSKQHKSLVRKYFAVDSLGGDPETYEKLREALIDAMKECCHWGVKRPIRWLCLERKLHDMQTDSTTPENERHLMKFQDIMKYASEYKLNTHEDVKVFLQFSHLCGDLTYFSTPELESFVISNPQWLMNVFRAIITLDEFYPDDPALDVDIDSLKNEGLIKTNSQLLPELWQQFIPKGEKKFQNEVIVFLLNLMVQFDLVVKHTTDKFLVPCLLPASRSTTKMLFPEMISAAPALYLRFHSSKQSFEDFKEGSKTNDQFLPHGLFPRLISRLVKAGWKWTEHKYQDLVSYTCDNCVIVLSTHSVWMKAEVLVPDTFTVVDLQKYSNCLTSEIDTILSAYIPNMWFEYCLNPCSGREHECVIGTGRSSIGGTENLVRCPDHGACLKKTQFTMWFSASPCRILTEKDLMSLSQELVDEWSRLKLATELAVEISDLKAAETDNEQTRLASFEMLHSWYNSQEYKTDAYITICNALRNAGLAGLVQKCLGDN